MRFALTSDHRDFFIKNHYIEFEGLFPEDQIALLKKSAQETMASRLKDKSANEFILAGYDLWRNNGVIKKIVLKSAVAKLASDLFQATPLRCAFDQYLCTEQKSAPIFSEPCSLQETSCLSPLAGALILPLQEREEPLPFFPLPLKRGNGLFVSPTLPIPWQKLLGEPEIGLLMIAYGMEKTFFRADTRDPRAVHLKKMGYAFNDLLKNATHPTFSEY